MTTETVELSGDAHDRLLSYQREDETIEETLHRVVPALVPHSVNFDREGIDPSAVDTDTSFIHERWPDEDGFVDTRLYKTITDYLRSHRTVIEHTDLEGRA
ncbi:hypothetical protein [Halomontanus rarus]|uniref:hypothetical protein n=1 Tax=Halomontanus rarus TaxID=3034020 RepID=UPI00307CA38D